MNKRVTAILLSGFLVAALLVGCGGKKYDTDASKAGAKTESMEAKDSLVIGVSSEFSQIVPNSNNTAVANRDGIVIYALYDTLLWRNIENGDIEPCLATGYEVSDDGLEYLVTLREDVTFHNGDTMDAEDVAWTYNLLPDNPNVMSQQAPTFDHAEVVDEYTVKFVLTSPFAPFINFMASYHMGILSKDYFEEVGSWDAYIQKPVGTGPYKFISRTIGTNLILEGYDGYWDKVPEIKNVTINILPDANSQIISLENGEVDALVNVNVQNLLYLKEDSGAKWESTISDMGTQLGFNSGNPVVMGDENLRKAIVSAINYDGLIDGVMGGYTEKAQANTHDNAGITARPADGTFVEAMSYDIDKAKEYLAASNYSGEQLTIICVSGSTEESIAKIIQGDLQTAGINAQVNPIDGASYWAKYYEPTSYELSLNTFLPSLFDSFNLSQGMARNARVYKDSVNPDKEILADLAERGMEEMNPEARTEIYRQYLNIINEHVYAGWIMYSANTLAYRTGLENAHPIAGSNLRISDWY